MERITEYYTKTNLLFNSQTFYYHSGFKTVSVNLVFIDSRVWSSEIKSMVNIDPIPISGRFNTGPWPIKQEPGNSTKEEFENALKLANLYLNPS